MLGGHDRAGTRTQDMPVKSRLLYQLSYAVEIAHGFVERHQGGAFPVSPHPFGQVGQYRPNIDFRTLPPPIGGSRRRKDRSNPHGSAGTPPRGPPTDAFKPPGGSVR